MRGAARHAILAVLLFAALAAGAKLPVADFSQPPDMTDDTQAALYLTLETWRIPVADANRLAVEPRLTPEDFRVAVFLASQAGVAPAEIWTARSSGRKWADVAAKYDVPLDQIMPTVARDYGPPYGKAYGFWRNHPKGRGDRSFLVDDVEYIALVDLQTLLKASGKPADEVISALVAGETFTRWSSSLYRQKHGRPDAPGKGSGKAKAPAGKSRGK